MSAALLLPGPWWLGLGLGLAGLALGRPRIRHGVMLRLRWLRASRAAGLNVALPRAPRVVSARAVAVGDELILRLPMDTSIDVLRMRGAQLAHALGVCAVRVEPVPECVGRARVTLVRRDPLADSVAPEWPFGSMFAVSLQARVPLAVDRDALPVTLDLRDHLLLEGSAGDTFGALSLVLAAAALDPQVELRLLDGSAVSLAAWHDLSARYAAAALDPDHGRALLLGMRDELGRRRTLALQRSSVRWEPEPGAPLILLVVHELHAHLEGEPAEELVGVLRELVHGGSRMGVMVLVTGIHVPTVLRAAMPVRWELSGGRTSRLVRRGQSDANVRCCHLSEPALSTLLDRARLQRAAWSDLAPTTRLPVHGWRAA